MENDSQHKRGDTTETITTSNVEAIKILMETASNVTVQSLSNDANNVMIAGQPLMNDNLVMTMVNKQN